MNETQLQAAIVAKFSQKYPKKRGQLFHVPNERNHALQAMKASSLGIVPGVGDLLFFSKKFNISTELKAPGYRHKVSQIKAQIKWGRTWVKNGKKNHWRLCKTVDEAISCYEGNYKGMTLKEVEDYLNAALVVKPNLQTIKF